MFDIESYCRDFGIPFGHSGIVSKNRIGIPCPSKGMSDTEYHAAFNPVNGSIYSWVLGAIPLREYLQWATPDISYNKLLKEYSTEFDYVQRLKVRENATQLDYNFAPLGKVARNYLHKRGFDVEELITKYKFRDGGFVGEWAYRVIIPIIDRDGRTVSWQGRTYANQDLRYKTLSIEKSLVDPKKTLYNLNNCNKGYVAVVEGVFDALKFGDNCCATLGTSVTEAQVQLLTEYKKVVIIFDSEASAQQRAKKLADRISALGVKEVTVVDLETDKDLGGMEYSDVQKVKEELGL